jgi:hypothetical protein
MNHNNTRFSLNNMPYILFEVISFPRIRTPYSWWNLPFRSATKVSKHFVPSFCLSKAYFFLCLYLMFLFGICHSSFSLSELPISFENPKS